MYALNFYSPIVADSLRSHRKTATIRLGDKSGKYRKGMVVQVLVGNRFGPRERVFDAVIDKIEVKTLGELSPREIEHDNPEIRRPEEMATFLGQLYNREITEEATVTGIRREARSPTRRSSAARSHSRGRRRPSRRASCGAPPGASRLPCLPRSMVEASAGPAARVQRQPNLGGIAAAWRLREKQNRSPP